MYISSMRLKRKGVSWDVESEKCAFGLFLLGTPTPLLRLSRISPEFPGGVPGLCFLSFLCVVSKVF